MRKEFGRSFEITRCGCGVTKLLARESLASQETVVICVGLKDLEL